jgi:hypothetical protein
MEKIFVKNQLLINKSNSSINISPQATSLLELEAVAGWLKGEDKQALEDKLREV